MEFDTSFRAGALGTLDNVEDEARLATQGDPEMSKRRVILVRYWGPDGAEPRNLQSTIHEAFEVPPLEGLQGEGATSDPPVRDGRSPADLSPPVIETPQQPKRASIPPLVQMIDQWRATGLLRQNARNDLRNIVHAAVVARLGLEDGYGGSPMWTSAGKPWDSAFDAQNSIKIGDQTVSNPLITIEKDDTESVRALRALAWVNVTEEWSSIENGEELQVLVEAQLATWTAVVSRALLYTRRDGGDPELAIAANTLLEMSKALGISDAFKDDALSRARALFAPAPLSPDGIRPKMRQWQHRVSADTQRLSREQLKDRVLRLASFAQGTGSPLALDLPRVAKALRGKESGTALPRASGLLADTVHAVESLQNVLPELRDEARSMVPDLGDLGGELPDVIKQLENLVSERASVGQLPAAIIRTDLTAAGRAIKAGDQNRIEAIRAKIDSWEQLSVDGRLRLLTDDWDEAAGRVRHWLSLATQAVEALETKLGAGASSPAHVEYEQTRSALTTTLQNLSTLLIPSDEARDVP